MNKFVPERRRTANRYLNAVKIMSGDITEQNVDAIVSLIPQNLEYKGELNNHIAKSAGADLQNFINTNIFNPKAGDVYSTPGFNLPCKHILFVVRPIWKTEFDRQDKVLLNACRRAMEEARALNLKSIAFPPIGCGNKGYPIKRGARLILQGIEDRLETVFENENFEEVRVIARTEKTCSIFRERIVQMGG